MKKEFIQYGHVNKEGSLIIYNRGLFLNKIRDYFASSNIEIIFRERTNIFSENVRRYYFGVLLGEIQKAYRASGVLKTLSDVDQEMRAQFLYYELIDEETGLIEKVIHTLRKDETEVTQRMFIEYIEMCIMWTAQSLDWVVAFPNEILKENDMTEHQANVNNISSSKAERASF